MGFILLLLLRWLLLLLLSLLAWNVDAFLCCELNEIKFFKSFLCECVCVHVSVCARVCLSAYTNQIDEMDKNILEINSLLLLLIERLLF